MSLTTQQPLNLNNLNTMKTLEYYKCTACCGEQTNDMAICKGCRDHAGEVYYTSEGDELSEVEVHAVDVLNYWHNYADMVPKPMQGYRILMHAENTITTAMMKAIVRVCDLYNIKTYLRYSDILGDYSLQVNIGENMTVFFKTEAKPIAIATDAKSALFAA